MAIKIRQSTGNVFRDLGFPREEAENLKIRADLMIQIGKVIRSRRLTRLKLLLCMG
jgi:predicted XRE-type DNA-binding protein